jgi:hypothetical protein
VAGAHLRAVLCCCTNQVLDNASIDVEKIITGHARLAGNTCAEEDSKSNRIVAPAVDTAHVGD